MPGKSKQSPTIIESTKSDSDKVENKTTNLGGKSDELLKVINRQEEIIKLATKLETDYEIECHCSDIDFDELGKIEWNDILEKKLNSLKSKPYAPKNTIDISSLNELDINEINRRIKLATKLETDYGIKFYCFDIDFDELGKIEWNDILEKKLNLLKGKPYAPKNTIDISSLNELDINEINRRITIADKEDYKNFIVFEIIQ